MIKKKTLPKQEVLHHLFHYDEGSGIFIWKKDAYSHAGWKRYGDTIAGLVGSNGYICIQVNNQNFFAHRLVWVYVYGDDSIKDFEIDHKDGNPLNNRIDNLRLATRAQNLYNKVKKKNSNAISKGIRKKGKKFYSRISYEGNIVHLGHYDTLEEAKFAYEQAALKYHGEFAKVG